MKKLVRIVCAFLATCFLTIGCAEKKFERSELIGEWQLVKAVRSPEIERQATMAFQLREDGRFSAINFPRDMFFSSPQRRSFISSSAGRWKLGESENGVPTVDLVFEKATGLEGRLPYGVRFFLSAHHGRPMLSFYQGDPDSDPRLDFERE
jgi:hypothetical protein